MHYALKGKYPIETLDQLTKTAEYFDKFLTRFDPKERVMVACNIEKRAEELNTYVDKDWIKNYSRFANNRETISPDFHNNMELRKQACFNKKIDINGTQVDAVMLLNRIEGEIDKHGGMIVVDELLDFDKLAGLEYQWDKSILDPIMTVYGSVVDAEFDAVKVAGDYTDYDIKKLALDADAISIIAKKIGNRESNKFFKHPIATSKEIGFQGSETIEQLLNEKERKKKQNG